MRDVLITQKIKQKKQHFVARLTSPIPTTREGKQQQQLRIAERGKGGGGVSHSIRVEIRQQNAHTPIITMFPTLA